MPRTPPLPAWTARAASALACCRTQRKLYLTVKAAPRTITSASHAHCISAIIPRTPPSTARTARTASAQACCCAQRKLGIVVKVAPRTIISASHTHCISAIMSRTPPSTARTAHAASAPACGYTPRKLDLTVKAASTPLCRPGLRRQTTFFSSQRSPRYRHTKNAPRTAQSVIIAIHTALSPSPYQAST